MKNLRNERGMALITALLLTLISLAMVMALLYLITRHTQLSAAHKRYKTALEASHGGAEIFAKQIIPLVFANNTTGGLASKFSMLNLQISVKSDCFKNKLSLSTADWGAACGGTDPNPLEPKLRTDMTLTLMGTSSQNFKVFTKIVDTVQGNSDLSGFELLESGAGVAGVSSGVAPKHIPAMYRIEVQGEKEVNPLEKARLSVLYAY